MLNVSEIKVLEEKWKAYKRKKYIKYSIYLLLSLILLSILLYIVYINFFKEDSCKKIEKVSVKKIVSHSKKEIKQNIKKVLHSYKSDKNISSNDITNFVKSDSKREDRLTLDKQFLRNIYKKSKLIDNKNGSMNKKDLNKSLKNENIDIKKEEADVKNRDSVIITSKKVDKIFYYKSRFLESKKVKYATILSKLYYDKGDYKNSLKWAIIANELDNENEESWILFAKNKIKLGRKDEAINALRTYLRVNSSQKIRKFLKDVEEGIFK